MDAFSITAGTGTALMILAVISLIPSAIILTVVHAGE